MSSRSRPASMTSASSSARSPGMSASPSMSPAGEVGRHEVWSSGYSRLGATRWGSLGADESPDLGNGLSCPCDRDGVHCARRCLAGGRRPRTRAHRPAQPPSELVDPVPRRRPSIPGALSRLRGCGQKAQRLGRGCAFHAEQDPDDHARSHAEATSRRRLGEQPRRVRTRTVRTGTATFLAGAAAERGKFGGMRPSSVQAGGGSARLGG